MRFGYDVRPDEFDRLPPRLFRPSSERGRQRRRPIPADEHGEGALAAWVLVSLIGVVLGLLFAKYSQAWAGDGLHPGAALGTLVILTSVGLTLVAGLRHASRGAPQPLVILSALLVFALAWGAVNVIIFAGWELPPSRAR